MRNKIYDILLFCLSALIVGCEEKPEPDQPVVKESEFSVDVEVKDGVRNASRVVTLPEIIFTIESKDEAANYVVEYSIDNGSYKSITGLWDGKSASVGSDLKAVMDFGKHVVTGLAYNEENPNKTIDFEKEFWITYKLSSIETPRLVTAMREVTLEDVTTVYKDERGEIIIDYSPADSFLPVRIESSDNNNVAFSPKSAKNEKGAYRLPFTVSGLGEERLTIIIENGPSATQHTYTLKGVEDTQGVTLGMDISPAPLSVNNEGLDVDIMVRTNQPKRFDVAYLIDDKPVDAVIETQISDVFSKTIPTTGLAEGQHKLSVTVTESDNQKVSVTKDATFYHGNLAILFDDKAVSRTTENILEVGKAVSMKVVGVPTEALYLVSPSFNAKKDKVTTPTTSWGEDQQGAWTLLPFSFGRSPIYIHIEGGKGRRIEFPVTRFETVPVKLTKTQDHSHYYIQIGENPTGTSPYSESTELQYNISARFDYAGRCDYETAADEGAASDLHINYPATRYDYAAYEKTDKRALFGQSLELIDLSSKVSEYAAKYYESEVWDKVKENQKKKQKYYYQLDVTELSLSVRVQNGTEDADCLKFSTDVNWDYLKFNQ